MSENVSFTAELMMIASQEHPLRVYAIVITDYKVGRFGSLWSLDNTNSAINITLLLLFTPAFGSDCDKHG